MNEKNNQKHPTTTTPAANAPAAHPLETFRHCPVCGSRRFRQDSFKSKHCDDCGFTYYANASAATAAFIRNSRGELLVAVRAKDPAKGTLDLPGGFADIGETAEQGIVREVREETGLHISQPRYLFSIPNRYPYSGMVINTLDMFFEAEADSDKPQADDDAASLEWMPLENIDPGQFGLKSISMAVRKYIDSN